MDLTNVVVDLSIHVVDLTIIGVDLTLVRTLLVFSTDFHIFWNGIKKSLERQLLPGRSQPASDN